ncbi:MAG: CHAT domain-containing protein, partial [Myxococcales bacterium]|nr:CHAT domain-containing protein [Myxococcales bacterium]
MRQPAEETALQILLEFARADEIGDAYALPERPTRYFLRRRQGGYVEGVLRWNAALLRRIAAIRTRGASPEDRQVVGRALRSFLADFGWEEQEARIVEAIGAGRAVVITIRSAAAELFRLPWPLLTIGESDRHLGALPEVLFRSEWPETHTTPAAQNAEPERVVVAWSSATRPVPWGRHVDAIQSACDAGDVPFDRTADVVANATPRALVERLAQADPTRPVGILHLLCHGAAVGDSFGLGLHGEDGAPVAVDAAMIRELLGPFADRVRLVVVLACDAANDGPWDATLGSVAQALHRAGFAAVIAPRYPLSAAGSVTLTRHLYGALLGGPASLEEAVRQTCRQLVVEHPDDIEWLSLQLFARAADGVDSRPVTFRPYRGLLSFEARHVRFFFGRDPERAQTLARLEALHARGAPRFLVVAGASGTGKSSMVLSGAATDLLARDRAAEAAPASHSALERVVEQLRRLLPGIESPAIREGARQFVEAMPSGAGAAAGWRVEAMRPGSSPLRRLEAVLKGNDSPALLLVVDQFEELFTQDIDPAERDAFARRLWQLSQVERPRVDVVVTIRVDFLGHCGQVAVDDAGMRLDKIAYSDDHQIFVAQLDPTQLRQIIEAPAHKVGLHLESGLADRMLADVAGEPGALPVLQYALDQLWQQRAGRRLTQAAYEAMGGVTGALHGKADAIIAGLDELHRQQARRLLVRLVSLNDDGASDTRRRALVDQVRPADPSEAAAFDAVLAELVDARLLFRGEEEGRASVEVAHEALIRRWSLLREWLNDDRDMLRQVAEIEAWATQYAAYETPLRGDQLGYAKQVRDKYPGQLSDQAIRFINESEAAAALAQHRRQRLTRMVIAVVGLTAVVMGVLAIRAWQAAVAAEAATVDAVEARGLAEDEKRNALAQKAEAESARGQAEQAVEDTRRAEENTRMAFVTNLVGRLDEDRALAAALLLTSARYRNAADESQSAEDVAYWSRWTRTAADLLSQPIPRTRLHLGAVDLHGPAGAVASAGAVAAISPDGTKVAVVYSDQTIRVWQSDGRGDPVATFSSLSVPAGSNLSRGRARAASRSPRLPVKPRQRGVEPWWRTAGWRARSDDGAEAAEPAAKPAEPAEPDDGAARPWQGLICGWRPDSEALLLCGDGVHVLELKSGDVTPLYRRGRASAAVWCADAVSARIAAPAIHDTPVADEAGTTAREKGFAVWRAGTAEWFVPVDGALGGLACSVDGQTIAAEYVPVDGAGQRVRLWLASMPTREIELER